MAGEILVLFSGGRDSFLSASRLVLSGNKTVLVSFDNGAVAGTGLLAGGARRLASRYGPDAVSYAGCYCTAPILQSFRDWQAARTWAERAKAYPALRESQVVCMACQTAMWTAAAAYARANGIPAIAAGYRKSDVFCTGQPWYVRRIASFLGDLGLGLRLPVWNDGAWTEGPVNGRNMEMAMHGFLPSAYEPKCLAGRPAEPPDEDCARDMERFLADVLLPVAVKKATELEPVFRAPEPSTETRSVSDRPPSDGNHGLY